MVCGMRRDGSTWLMVVVDRPLVPWWSWMGCWDAATHGCCSAAMCWSSRWPVQFSIHRLVCLGCTGCMPKDSAGVHFYSLGWNLYVQRTEQSIQPRFTTIFLSMCTCRHLRCGKGKRRVVKYTCHGSELFHIWLKQKRGRMAYDESGVNLCAIDTSYIQYRQNYDICIHMHFIYLHKTPSGCSLLMRCQDMEY